MTAASGNMKQQQWDIDLIQTVAALSDYPARVEAGELKVKSVYIQCTVCLYTCVTIHGVHLS